MARPPDGDVARTERLSFRVTRPDLAAINAARGDLSRSEYLRQLIEAETAPDPEEGP